MRATIGAAHFSGVATAVSATSSFVQDIAFYNEMGSGGADPAAALEEVGVPRRAFPRSARGIALADVIAGGEQDASEKLDAMDARAAPPPPPEPVKSFRWWPVQLFLALLLAVDLYLVASRRSLATETPVDALDADVLAEVEVDSSPAEEL